MNEINLEDVRKYVNEHIGEFHTKSLEEFDRLKLLDVLKSKNPCLFKVKNMLTSGEIVLSFVDAHVFYNEETIFGEWLKGLAIFINRAVYGGWKSGIPGIDLEFDKDNIRYIVSIKSGPNWANRSQLDKLKQDFLSAAKSLRTSSSHLNVVAINGCCYGRDNKPDKGVYQKYCGQRFWEFISGNENLYLEIIEPLGYNAKAKNDEYDRLYSSMINRFTGEFFSAFCKGNGEIDWNRLVQYNSSISGLI